MPFLRLSLLSILGIVFLAGSTVHATQYLVISGFGGKQIKIKNADPSVGVSISQSGAIFFGSRHIIEKMQETQLSQQKPTEPKLLSIRHLNAENKNSMVLGAWTELKSGSGVWIGSRHLVQNLTSDDLADSFERAGLNLEHYEFFEFFDDLKHPIDAVIAVPIATRDLWIAPSQSQNFRLTFQPEFASEIRAMDLISYYSFSAVGTSTQMVTSPQISWSIGCVSRVDHDQGFAYVNPSADIHSDPGSSGAIVYSASPVDVSTYGIHAWKVGALIECKTPSVLRPKSKIHIPDQIRMISFSKLLSSSLHVVPIKKLIEPILPFDPNCPWIDRRDGG